MMSVKTNEEYRALQNEIEHAQKHIRKIEDDILNLMMEAETVQAEIKTAEARLKEDQQRVDAERKQLEEENQAGPQRARGLSEGAQGNRSLGFAGSVPRYDRVRKHRGGIGCAPPRETNLRNLPGPHPAAGFPGNPQERSDHRVRCLPAHPVQSRKSRSSIRSRV